jgi:hypothetical protein
MTLGGIVILLLLVASLIIFIYLIVISARGWGVLHTVMLCFLFIECWVFMIFTAGVLHRRVGWLEQAHKLEEKTLKAEANAERLTWGGENIAPDEPDSVILAKGELRRLTADRGRVWRRLELVSSDAGAYKLEMKTAAPAQDLIAGDPAAPVAAAAPADTATSLPANLVVHCFAEEANEQNQALPNYYLGEFKVTASQAGQVTLSPTLPLDPAQVEMVKSGGATTWALYELLPLDSHTAFAAPGSKADDQMLFGRMDEASLDSLLNRIPDDRRQKVRDDYLRDGTAAKPDGSDPIASRWVNVKLLKEYSIDVDGVDAIATELGFFDSQGRSVDSRLKRKDVEGDLKLTPDVTKPIVLKSEAADKLIASGIAELVTPYFVRPLIDYQEAFNSTYVRRHEVSERIALYQREAAELTKANVAGQEMISFRQIENQKLTLDLGNYKKEVDVLKKEVVLAEDKLAATKAKISEMYRQIQTRAGIVSQ